MKDIDIYADISKRTGGNIYVGVVGPVRTGKSTFIKRFMETLVIPNIDDEYMKERANDELPQSGSGSTIMTTEPKFVPEEAVNIHIDGETNVSVRLIDSVGYLIDGVSGIYESGVERLVSTPWSDKELTISEAAELGTRKVITDHSTIGIVITTDGTVTDIERSSYIDAEERIISELKALGKPFVILLNTAYPDSESVKLLQSELSEKYRASVIVKNCLTMGREDISEIIRSVLYEFPLTDIGFILPTWLEALNDENEIHKEILTCIKEYTAERNTIRDCIPLPGMLMSNGIIRSAISESIDLGRGVVRIRINLSEELYYSTISENTGFEISDDGDMVALLMELSDMKKEYDRLSKAIDDVRKTGYGIVVPSREEMKLDEPAIVKQGGHYGVKLKARAPTIHMISADIETEVSPTVGGGRSSDAIVNFLLQGLEGDTSKIWDSNIFGKSLYDIAEEGLEAKITSMSDDTRSKLREMLVKVVNEGGNGVICFIV